MATFKEIVNKHLTKEQKEFFAKVFKFETPVVDPNKPVITPDNKAVATPNAEAKTVDGTVIKSDSPNFIVGSVITVVTPEGELPAPDGDIMLENGTKLVIVNGAVAEIEEAKGAETPIVEVVTPEQMADMKSEYDKKLEESAKIISALVSRFDSVEKENTEIKSKFENFSEEFAKLMDLPIGEPIPTEQNHVNTKKERALKIFNSKNK